MEKQKKQLIIAAVMLIAVIGIYFTVSKISVQGEDEAAELTEYKVADIEPDNVTRLVFTNDSGTVKLTQNDDAWNLDDDQSIDIDEEKVNALISNALPLLSQNCIENVDDLSQYGLLEPVGTVMVSDGNNKYTIFIGDYNDIAETYYICLEEDENTVYTADSSFVNAFDITADDITAE